jgi:aryl-alcohol dehydrogenase-like predicted oxidoreductase
VIGLGLAALGRPGYLNLGHGSDLGDDRSVAGLRRRAYDVLDAAFAGGVRYFDAARSYGLAEEFLSSWLSSRGIAPGLVAVGSKWGYEYTAGWQVDADPPEVKDLSVEHFRRQLGETMELLGEHLGLYQIHSATVESGVLSDSVLLGELASLRSSGVAVGLSVSGAGQAGTVDMALEVGGFDSVQATWNLIEPSASEALARASAGGMRVIVKEALANGRLTARGDAEPLLRVARSMGATPDAVALAAALAQPWCDVVLSGASTVKQLDSNLAARDMALDEAALSSLEALREPADSYWQHRSALPWT